MQGHAPSYRTGLESCESSNRGVGACLEAMPKGIGCSATCCSAGSTAGSVMHVVVPCIAGWQAEISGTMSLLKGHLPEMKT